MEKLGDIGHVQGTREHRPGGFRPGVGRWLHAGAEHPAQRAELSFAAKVAYAKLLSYAWHNNLVFPGQERMAADIGLSTSVINARHPGTAEAGWLEMRRRGQGMTNIYVLKYRVSEPVRLIPVWGI